MSRTQKYIQDAVQAAKDEFDGHQFHNCTLSMTLQADGAAELLAEALLQQAKANQRTSEAMSDLARMLKPVDACVIRAEGSDVKFGSAHFTKED